MTVFLEHIYALKVQEREDSLVGKNDGRGKFSIKSYYKSLRAENMFYSLPKRSWVSVLLLEVIFLLGKQFGEKS